MPTTRHTHEFLDFETPIVELDAKIEELENFASTTEMNLTGQIEQLRARSRELKREIFMNLSDWQRVKVARHPKRDKPRAPRLRAHLHPAHDAEPAVMERGLD